MESVQNPGNVTPDALAQAANRLLSANRAFDVRSFGEASVFYTNVLEDDPDNYTAICRKGICAVYLSTPGAPPRAEFDAAMERARNALGAAVRPGGKSAVDLITARDTDIVNMLDNFVLAFEPTQAVQPSMDSCKRLYAALTDHAEFASAVIAYMETEALKEHVLSNAIEYCQRIERSRLKYKAGSVADKNGVVKESVETAKISGADEGRLKSVRNALSLAFNSLPSRVEREGNLTAVIQILDGEVNHLKAVLSSKKKELNKAKKAFWNANPNLKGGRGKAILPALVIAMIALIVCGLLVWLKKLWICAAIGIAVIVLCFFVGRLMLWKYERSVFDIRITEQLGDIAKDLKKLKETKSKLNVEKNRLKDFDRSKK